MIRNETHPEKPLHPGNDPRQNSSKLVKTRQNRKKFVFLDRLKKTDVFRKTGSPTYLDDEKELFHGCIRFFSPSKEKIPFRRAV
jgi:hypothetical protein